jgi:putative transposase
MQNNNPYTLALLATESHFSATKAARVLKTVSHDHLTRSLLKGSPTASLDLATLPPGYLLVDDTILDKSHCQVIEGVSKLYSANDKKFVKGYCWLVFLWVEEKTGRETVLYSHLWDPNGPGKNEVFRETCQRFYTQGLCPQEVLFDAWYASAENLNLLDGCGWVYASKVKSNRLFGGVPLSHQRFPGATGRVGRLSRVAHTVQVMKRGTSYVVSNQLTRLTSRSGWLLYSRRWPIETFFRTLKNLLHLERCACRSRAAQEAHLACCVSAYAYLQDTYPSLTRYEAREEYLENFYRQKYSQADSFSLAA